MFNLTLKSGLLARRALPVAARAFSSTTLRQTDSVAGEAKSFSEVYDYMMPLLETSVPHRAGPRFNAITRLSQYFTTPEEIPQLQEAIKTWRVRGRPIPGFATRQILQRLIALGRTDLAREMIGDVKTYGLIPHGGDDIRPLLRALCAETVAATDAAEKAQKLQALAEVLAMLPQWNLRWDANAYDCLMRACRSQEGEEAVAQVITLAEEARKREADGLDTLADSAIWAYRQTENAEMVKLWKDRKWEITQKASEKK